MNTAALVDVAESAHHDSQRWLRRNVFGMVGDVVRYHRLDLASLNTLDTGDGLRLLLPFSVLDPVRVVDMLVLGLSTELREHRRYVAETARIRMRLAVDYGPVEPDANGWTGDPLVRVARLIEAEPLRAALAADDRVDLAAVVSDRFFDTFVRDGRGYLRSSCFREIDVTVKEFTARAWQLVPSAAGICSRCYGLAA